MIVVGRGLRGALTHLAYAEDQYEAWAQRYHDATVSLENREDKIEAVSDEIEHDLLLLGATAIEDRLQDGVPEAIADLKEAGIKVWVLTGDKLETAIGESLRSRQSSSLGRRQRADASGGSYWSQHEPHPPR